MPYGNLRLDTLKEVHRLAVRHGLQLWLPEPVLWEWQEHAERLRSEARAELRKRSTILEAAGVLLPQLPSDEEARRQIHTAVLGLGTPLTVLPLSGQVAKNALRDQILVLEPGERVNVRPAGSSDGTNADDSPKKNTKARFVKTGGSDSAILRIILGAASNDTKAFVILGGDKDLSRAAKAWNLSDIQSCKNLGELTDFLSKAAPVPVSIPPLAYQSSLDRLAIVSGIQRSSLESLTSATTRSSGFDTWPDDDIRDGLLNTAASIESVDDVIGLNSIDDVGDGELSARIFMLATVDLSAVRQSDDGSEILPFNALLNGVLVVSPVLIRRDNDEIIVIPDGSATVHAPSTHFNEAGDAFEAATEALRVCPGLEDFEFPDAYDGASETEVQLSPELKVTFEVFGSVHEDWQILITVSHMDTLMDGYEMDCSYDDNAYVGGSRDGFHLYPPWHLTPAGGDPAWRAAAWLTQAIQNAVEGSSDE